MKVGLFICIVIIGLLYEKVWGERQCQGHIAKYVKEKEGILLGIQKLSSRKEIFAVRYRIKGIEQRTTIKFNFFYQKTII